MVSAALIKAALPATVYKMRWAWSVVRVCRLMDVRGERRAPLGPEAGRERTSTMHFTVARICSIRLTRSDACVTSESSQRKYGGNVESYWDGP